MRTQALRLGIVLAIGTAFSACIAMPTGPSSSAPPSELDQAFFRICPFCEASGPTTVRTGTLTRNEPGDFATPPRDVDVGTIRLTIRPLTGLTFNGITHRIDIVATLANRTIEVPSKGTYGTVFGTQMLSADSIDPGGRMCAAPGLSGPPLFVWPDQSTSLMLRQDDRGLTGLMTHDTCPDDPRVLTRELYGVRITP
jgi:hypothetical protein